MLHSLLLSLLAGPLGLAAHLLTKSVAYGVRRGKEAALEKRVLVVVELPPPVIAGEYAAAVAPQQGGWAGSSTNEPAATAPAAVQQ